MRVVLVTYLPSPYQVELFDAISADGTLDLCVMYLKWQSGTPIARHWLVKKLNHSFIRCETSNEKSVVAQLNEADLVVFNYYQHEAAIRWMSHCAKYSIPWCFWGERLGYTRWALLGRYYRQWKLRILHKSRAAIWGIGRLAVERYQTEFGTARRYFNVPYFSELGKFVSAGAMRRFDRSGLRFLFSGALIRRKGVDLLADAFLAVAREFPTTSLTIIGTGDEEGALRAKLAGVSQQVRFLGFQTWDELPKSYAAADVLLAPSRYDGWAMVVPEGLAAGLPVISTTATGAACEFIRAGENGWLIRPGDCDALLAAMRRACKASPAEAQRRSEEAKRSVASHQLADGVRRFNEAVRGSLESFKN